MDNTYDLGPLWANAYVRHLGITDHIRELLIIDDELRRTKNRKASADEIEAIKTHFTNELADLVLIALKDLDPSVLDARRKKFLAKAEEDSRL